MSIIDTLPDDVRADIAAKNLRIREDLRLIPEAEAAGWTVSFRNDSWHNAAMYERGAFHVWYSSTGWRRAELVGDRYTAPVVYTHGEIGLRGALDL